MSEDLMILLAFDSLLKEIDPDYSELSKDKFDFIKSRIFESYGMAITSDEDDIEVITNKIIKDLNEYKDSLIKSL